MKTRSNKLVTETHHYNIYKAPSRIEGNGAFAAERIPARRKIGNLGGEVITRREADRRAAHMKRIAMVELNNGKALDASINGHTLRYVNHCCAPNTYMRCINNLVEFYALRAIGKNEELTCNYGLTHHDGELPCSCGAPSCKGFI